MLSIQKQCKQSDAVDASGGSVRYVIPNHADIIVANATVDGIMFIKNNFHILCHAKESLLFSLSRDMRLSQKAYHAQENFRLFFIIYFLAESKIV